MWWGVGGGVITWIAPSNAFLFQITTAVTSGYLTVKVFQFDVSNSGYYLTAKRCEISSVFNMRSDISKQSRNTVYQTISGDKLELILL